MLWAKLWRRVRSYHRSLADGIRRNFGNVWYTRYRNQAPVWLVYGTGVRSTYGTSKFGLLAIIGLDTLLDILKWLPTTDYTATVCLHISTTLSRMQPWQVGTLKLPARRTIIRRSHSRICSITLTYQAIWRHQRWGGHSQSISWKERFLRKVSNWFRRNKQPIERLKMPLGGNATRELVERPLFAFRSIQWLKASLYLHFL